MFFFKRKNQSNNLYGWKFELNIDNSLFDISNEILEKNVSKEFLDVKENFDFKKYISNYNPNYKNCFLKISNKFNKFWEPLTIKEFTPFKIYLGNIKLEKKLDIVYFINSDLTNSFFKLFKDQLKDIIKSKIFKHQFVKIHIVIICSKIKKRVSIEKIINKIKLSNFFDFELIFSDDQNKEYEGINKVWELANNNEDKLILYFHGKGLSYIANPLFYIRQPLEKFIFKLLIHNWKTNLEKFHRLESISKVGILTGGNGWLWFNFWIARSGYLSNLEKPKKTKYACYYEDWLGRTIINKSNKKNLIYTNEENENFYNTINETYSILDDPKKFKYNLGSACEVKKGGFVGLGITKYTYRIWYLIYVLLNKIGLNKGQADRFMIY